MSRRKTIEVGDVVRGRKMKYARPKKKDTVSEVSLKVKTKENTVCQVLELTERNNAKDRSTSPLAFSPSDSENENKLKEEIPDVPSLIKSNSMTLRDRIGEPYDPNYHIKCCLLYSMQFCQVVFTAPIYIVVPIYLENEFHGKKGKWDARGERWGFDEKTTTMIVLTLASLDFIMPLLTPYIYKYIKVQHVISNCLAILSTFCFCLADLPYIKGPLWYMIVGGIFNSFGNSFHIIEIYIRFISPLKSKQSSIIETNMMIFVVSTIIVIGMVNGLYIYGEDSRKGMTYTAGLGATFGVFAMTCLCFFYKYVDIDMEKLKKNMVAEKKMKDKKVAYKPYWSPAITMILVCRFFISFNQTVLKLVILPLMQSTDDGHGLALWQASVPVVFGIICAVFYLYYTKDTYHDHPLYWYPFPEGIGCLGASILLFVFIFIGTSNSTSIPRLCVLGVMFFFGFVLQAKLTIDRNTMTNNLVVDRSASYSLICNGTGVLIATLTTPNLKAWVGTPCMYVNVFALFGLALVVFIFFYSRSSWLTTKLEKYTAKYYAKSKHENEKVWSEKLIQILLAKVEEKEAISEVAKERLFSEFKSEFSTSEVTEKSIEIDSKEHGDISFQDMLELSSSCLSNEFC